MVKQRRKPATEKTVSPALTDEVVEAFASGADGKATQAVNMVVTSINLSEPLLTKMEDLALANKRAKRELRSVSAIIRDALEQYFLIGES